MYCIVQFPAQHMYMYVCIFRGLFSSCSSLSGLDSGHGHTCLIADMLKLPSPPQSNIYYDMHGNNHTLLLEWPPAMGIPGVCSVVSSDGKGKGITPIV